MKKKINTVFSGILLGVIPTAIFYFLLFHNKYSHLLNTIHVDANAIRLNIIPIFISRCMLPSIILFFIFIYTNNGQAAKGILISVSAITVILFIISFVF